MGRRLRALVLGLAGALGLLIRPTDAGSAEGADPAGTLRLPKVGMMRWTQGENIHIGNQEGAINRRASIVVSIELLDKNKLRGSDWGTRSEHNLFSNFSTKEETTWRNRWSGTWALAGGSLRLDLKLDERTCKRTKTTTGAAPEKLACQTPSPKLRMECTTQQLEMELWEGPPDAPVRKISQQAAWVCSPSESAELLETPSRWVLTRDIACMQVNPGRGGITYSTCPPLEPSGR